MVIVFYFIEISRIKQSNTYLSNELNKCTNAYSVNLKTLKSLDKINSIMNNHVYRMQLIAGVKNPDTVFKWIEKVKHPINTKIILKHDIPRKNNE